jgi:hypothetical protein
MMVTVIFFVIVAVVISLRLSLLVVVLPQLAGVGVLVG